MFLEYPTDSKHAVYRIDRFMAAWQLEKGAGESKPATPYSMVDSGQFINWGDQDFQTLYRKMIEAEMLRPPLAIISAIRERPDTGSLRIKAQVTNISTTTLLTAANGATVHVALWEGNRALKAGTEIKGSAQGYFTDPLLPGDTTEFEFNFSNLPGTNLSAVDAVVMLDYQPPGESLRWDMMQAAIARTGSLPPVPTPLPSPTPEPTRTPIPTAVPTIQPTVEPTVGATAEPPPPPLYLPRVLRRWSDS